MSNEGNQDRGDEKPIERDSRDEILTRAFPVSTRGEYPTHGDSPSSSPQSTNGSLKGFDPDYLCVLYIRFSNGPLLIRQAYKYIKGDSSDVSIALHIIDIVEHYHAKPIDPPPADYHRRGLKDFGFGSQQVVAVFIDNHSSYVKFNTSRTTDRVISFAPFSSEEEMRNIRPNRNFYQLRCIPIPSRLSEGKEAILLNFYNRNSKGDPIKVDPNIEDSCYWYSMNIHLLMAAEQDAAGAISWVPIVFDPDTGNMGTAP